MQDDDTTGEHQEDQDGAEVTWPTKYNLDLITAVLAGVCAGTLLVLIVVMVVSG